MNLFMNKYPIYQDDTKFSLDKEKIKDEPGFHFSKDNWNDWGYETSYKFVYVFDDSQISEILSVKITSINDTAEEFCLENVLSGNEQDSLVSLGDSQYYDFLNSLFSQKEREIWFKLIGDLAFDLKKFENVWDLPREKNSWGMETNVIQDSLLRDRNRSEVINQLHRMTQGHKYQEKYSIEIKFHNSGTSLVLKTDPDTKYPDNLYAIIGNNGTGKTFLIKEIVNQFLNYKEKFDNQSKIIDVDQISDFENLMFISYSPFDKHDYKNIEGVFQYVGLKKENENSISDTMTNQIFDAVNKLGKEKRKTLENILKNFSFDPSLSNFFQNFNFENNILPVSEKDNINKLSSGQKIIISSLINLILYVSEKTLVIIDEPELFLHPPLQKAYIRAIGEIVSLGNGIGLFATHSSITLQEIPNHCILRIEYSEDNNYVYRNMETKTFGESISFINEVVFGLDLRNTGYYNLLCELSDKGLITDEIEEMVGSEGRLLLRTLKQGSKDEEN